MMNEQGWPCFIRALPESKTTLTPRHSVSRFVPDYESHRVDENGRDRPGHSPFALRPSQFR